MARPDTAPAVVVRLPAHASALPEPTLRGLAGARTAVARALPDGLDEAWAMLVLDLDDAGRQSRCEPEIDDTSRLRRDLNTTARP